MSDELINQEWYDPVPSDEAHARLEALGELRLEHRGDQWRAIVTGEAGTLEGHWSYFQDTAIVGLDQAYRSGAARWSGGEG